MYKFYQCTCNCQNQSDWLNNFWKLRFGSFGIGLWIRWARHSMVFEHPWFFMCRLSNVGLSQYLTGAIFETGAYGVPIKPPKSFICGGVRQTINLKSPGKGAPPSTPSWGLQ